MTSQLDWSFYLLAKISFDNANRQNKRLVEALFLDQFQVYENFEVGILFSTSQSCRKKCKITKWPTFENCNSAQDMQTISDLNQTGFSNYGIKSLFIDILGELILSATRSVAVALWERFSSTHFFQTFSKQTFLRLFFLESYITSFPLSFHQTLPSSFWKKIKMLRDLTTQEFTSSHFSS